MDAVVIDTLPPLDWTNGPGAVAQTTDGALLLTAAAGTDWTNSALGDTQQHRATALGFVPTEDFWLSAQVSVATERTTYDAGALAIWGDADHWAKLCFEYSPQGEAMVVTVVTNEYSDDCNSTIVTGDHVYLRVIRSGPGWAFHSSADGVSWDFVRVFRLAFEGEVRVGFVAQAPKGETCTAAFEHIAYGTDVPVDLRDGS